MKESIIQRAICDYLTMIENRGAKVYWFRSGAGAVKMENGRFFKTGKPGVADITILYDHRYIACEIKKEKGRQSQTQKNTQAQVEAAGGEYYIVRSINDVKAIIPAP